MKTKYHVLTIALIAVFWIVTLAIPETIRNVIYGLIAGWQIGTWAQEYAQYICAKQAAKDVLRRF